MSQYDYIEQGGFLTVIKKKKKKKKKSETL
jgi:hypothetical protein